MGEVVNIADWRKKKARPKMREVKHVVHKKPDEFTNLLGGIEFTYKAPTVEQVMNEIQHLLQESHDCMVYMPQLRTVAAREQAVLDSMKFRERADKLAADNGWVIEKGDDNKYIVRVKE